MRIVAAESTDLFVGTADRPLQVVSVGLAADDDASTAWSVTVEGDGFVCERPASVVPSPSTEVSVEVGVAVDARFGPGTALPAEVVARTDQAIDRRPVDLIVAEPGWRMFMVSHFHYDPVWWNTQAAYTEAWGADIRTRRAFQEPGLALVKGHLDMARRDPDYKFVLAELDYLKPYWDAYPQDRTLIRDLLGAGRLELMGGTYNEPNTNLTSAESTIRNVIYGVAYQRDVLGGEPRTAWQLDAFGHDPIFPAIIADGGLDSSSWARGPFHEWGPNWVRGPARQPSPRTHVGEEPRMQFTSEFDWLGPSGHGVLTSFMPDHYSAGWWMDAAATLEEAEAECHRLFRDLQAVAATKNAMLPVGTDYSPPNKWISAIARDWNARYVWPRFTVATPREFFDAVREERAATGRGFSPQTRDMNPVYTGKDVSFIDTKQAQRIAENTLLAAEKFSTLASLLGARYPTEAVDKAWRQLLFGAHHDGITGSESDQVYLDLLGGWREATELATTALDGALRHLGTHIDTSGNGTAVTVFNALSWPRTDVARVTIELPGRDAAGMALQDDAGATVPFVLEATERGSGGSARMTVAFIASDVPALGHRTYRAVASAAVGDDVRWHEVGGTAIENAAYRVEVDPQRGGAIGRIVERQTGKELLRDGEAGNELLAYGEYPNHPHFAEGPWHLTPDGTRRSSIDSDAEVVVEESPIGSRVRVRGPFADCRREQTIVLWHGIDRIECITRLDGFAGQDTLFRVHFPAAVTGGAPVAEVGNAVVGRGFGFPNVDVAEVPFTLDDPSYDWFALGSTARVALLEDGSEPADARASRAIGVAEVVAPAGSALDEAMRELVVALVRQGVTSTLSQDDGGRYGTIDLDSNLPDVRLSIGRREENRFTAMLLDAADPGYAAELERQLAERGQARVWVPAARRLAETWLPGADLRGPRELPVLIVAGTDDEATIAQIRALVDDLADATIEVIQPAALDGTTERLEPYTVALLNRGLPGSNVETTGSLYLSLMRSCSGWPSGVWIDPPRRTAPDGSNFQFQHWSHTFEYALVGAPGDWRTARAVQRGHEYDTPLVTRVLEAHPGRLPPTGSLIEVQPSTAVLTAFKPHGDPMAHMAGTELDPAGGVALRLYESAGVATRATVRSFIPLRDAFATNILEEQRRPLAAADGAADGIAIDLEPCATVTVVATPDTGALAAPSASPPHGKPDLAPRGEPAQPVFSDYWLHNKGPAPMGYQPVTVQIGPGRLTGSGPFTLPITVASERTDAPTAGSLRMAVPPGWTAAPDGVPYRLAPGAHLALDVVVTPAPDAGVGRFFAAARIGDDAGQVHEDVVTIDLGPADEADATPDAGTERSPEVTAAIERAMGRVPRLVDWPDAVAGGATADDMTAKASLLLGTTGVELEAQLPNAPLRVAAGGRGELTVTLRNLVAGEIRGEAQLISPHETWPLTSPWTQGFTVGPGQETPVTFAVHPPPEQREGEYWALIKVMYFGRIIYTEAIPIVLGAG